MTFYSADLGEHSMTWAMEADAVVSHVVVQHTSKETANNIKEFQLLSARDWLRLPMRSAPLRTRSRASRRASAIARQLIRALIPFLVYTTPPQITLQYT